ncbi:MAG: heme-binding protein [Burkholderiales bacterium]|nr:heme-binding protein [Burkholderiales bacterium]
MKRRGLVLLASLVAACLAACSGGGGGGTGTQSCTGDCNTQQPAQDFLTAAEVQRIISQAAAEASARNVRATIAVTDRVGNVLGVFQMTGADSTVEINSGKDVVGGLDGIAKGTIPASLAAIAKAVTGAYLSSSGNAFSTRTASQIVQEYFNPREFTQPSGPLYGVQFSQLICSDLIRRPTDGMQGPKASPLGLSADPGGLPLYKNGRVVGGIGVIADGRYSLDLNITDIDSDVDELVAVAGSAGFAAPADIRGDRITADGRTFRYVDSESLSSNPASPPAFASLPGSLIAVTNYTTANIRDGSAFGSTASGYRADTGAFADLTGFVLVDAANANRYTPRAGTDSRITANEATQILREALSIANRARAQIRRPLGSAAQVTISVVDTNGEVLGVVRTPDAPIFGTDVSLQKARGALVFSHPNFAAEISALPGPRFLAGAPVNVIGNDLVTAYVTNSPAFPTRSFSTYVSTFRDFVGDSNALTGNVAYSMRAVGNLHRPYFPDGVANTPPGPLSTPITSWSPFNVGFQLDLVYNQLIKSIAAGDTSIGCAGRQPAGATGSDVGFARARNGIQIFPGGVPIYRGTQLVGAIGVSGDGVDQDDMIAFLGVANAGRALNTGIANAPANIRSDLISVGGTGARLRYVQCPQAPFNGSSEQNVCAGL